MEIGVIGTGYVGLIQATGLSKIGLDVVGLDIFQEKIDQLNAGIPIIYENGLDDLLQETYKKIDFTTDINKVAGCDIIFLCVGTPQDDSGKTNLGYLEQATKDLKKVMKGNEIIIIKSTVPVGTNEVIYNLLDGKHSVVSNPEFLREGLAIEDFFSPDRIVLGFKDDESSDIINQVKSVYSFFTEKNIDIVTTNWQTAELIKYAANSFLATKITFINEVARIADASGANIKDISTAIGLDPRIGDKFLNAGIGYGGSCFPKDVKSLIHQYKQNDLEGSIIDAVDRVNESQVDYFLEKIFSKYNNNLQGKKIGIIGVAFKPGTDDLRESRSLIIVQKLIEAGAILKVYDYTPKALENFEKFSYSLSTGIRNFTPITIATDFQQTAKDVDSLIIAIEDKQILSEDLTKLNLHDNIIFDGKNILDRKEVEKNKIEYIGIGV